jgi:hypothetical protein
LAPGIIKPQADTFQSGIAAQARTDVHARVRDVASGEATEPSNGEELPWILHLGRQPTARAMTRAAHAAATDAIRSRGIAAERTAGIPTPWVAGGKVTDRGNMTSRRRAEGDRYGG